MVFVHKLPLLVRQVPGGGAAIREGLAAIGTGEGSVGICGHHLVGGVEHEPRYLREGQPGGQVLCPLLVREPPVLIG